ncbi:4Fe-4S dicluster domain-containing protein [Anaerocolumna sedimenticola]|uniref:4Fe-4S dicluster domain-containing protein n=1 Tax=Anaerocolumna sedimenticola TaxID=2696063 RepID=UPI001FE2E798|nr:4Fe-4S dicluster domain-containing protein [Anaerocolumna sedimenticola]
MIFPVGTRYQEEVHGHNCIFESKDKCCACAACMNVCPKQAITMQPDEYGYLYPQIDREICVECGACQKVCVYQNNSFGSEPMQVLVAANRNKEQLINSASGGAFSAVRTTKFLQEGGVVFGATLTFENGHANPYHIAIETVDNLPKLQGSKYVQSSIGNCFSKPKRF